MFVPGLGGIIFFECSEYFPLFRWPTQKPRFGGSTRTRYPFLIYFVVHQTVTKFGMVLQRMQTLVNRVQR